MSEAFSRDEGSAAGAIQKESAPDLYIITPKDLLEGKVHEHAGWRIGAIVDHLEDEGIHFGGEDEMEFLRSRPDVAIRKGYIDRCEYTRLLFPAAGDRYIPTLKLISLSKSKIFMPGSSLYREYNWNSDGRLVVRGKRPKKQRGG